MEIGEGRKRVSKCGRQYTEFGAEDDWVASSWETYRVRVIVKVEMEVRSVVVEVKSVVVGSRVKSMVLAVRSICERT